MTIARSTKASGGTDFVTGYLILADEVNTDLNTIVSGVNNTTIADANVVAGANIDPSKIGDYSATDGEFQTTLNATARVHASNYTTITLPSKPTNAEQEFASLRHPWAAGFAGIISNTTGLPVADQWYASIGKGVVLACTGMVSVYFGTTAPSGWILWSDGTIGNGASGGTVRANTDVRELYRMTWRMFDNTLCPVTGGRGADPDADFDAAKPMRLPLATGRVLGVAGTPAAANITESYAMTAGGGGHTTTLINVSSELFRVLDTDTFDNYTVRFDGNITANLAGDTTQITGTTDSGTLTAIVINAVSDAPQNGDTFTIYRTVTTRTHGATAGLEETVLAGDSNDALAGSGGNGSAGSFANGTGKVTNIQPSFWVNHIIKL